MVLASTIEHLYALNVGITPLEEGVPREKPQNPLRLLAAFDLPYSSRLNSAISTDLIVQRPRS